MIWENTSSAEPTEMLWVYQFILQRQANYCICSDSIQMEHEYQ